MTPFRSVLHGACLVDGRHPEGSDLARECPVLRRQARSKLAPQGPDQRAAAAPLSRALRPATLAPTGGG
jgi:hypothetical protein